MLLRDTKVGDTVFMYMINYGNTTAVTVNKEKNYLLTQVYVLEHIGNYTTVGWKVNLEMPTDVPKVFIPSKEWIDQGIIAASQYGNWCACEPYTNNNSSSHSMNRQEKPCIQCKRPNDLGVKNCWWCECDNPTRI